MTTILSVDVSSHQTPSRELLDSWIAAGAQLILIHAYTGQEQAGLDASTRAWYALAHEAGIWAASYVFLFGGLPAEIAVQDAINLTRECGGDARLLALDCEEYGDESGPSVDQILVAAGECYRQRVQPIIYGRAGWLRQHPDLWRLSDLPGWLAQYDSEPVLSVADDAGLQLIGKQYTDLPFDWSVWDVEALTSLAERADPCQSIREGLRTELEARRPSGRLRALSRSRLRRLLEA